MQPYFSFVCEIAFVFASTEIPPIPAPACIPPTKKSPAPASVQGTRRLEASLPGGQAAAYSAALSFTSSILPHAPLPEPEHFTYTPTVTVSPSATSTPVMTGTSHTL